MSLDSLLRSLGTTIGRYVVEHLWTPTDQLHSIPGGPSYLLDVVPGNRNTYREHQRRFEKLCKEIIKELQPLIELTRSGTDEHEIEAIIFEVSEAFTAAGPTSELLVRLNLDPVRLASYIRAARPDARAILSADGAAVYDRLLLEVSRRIILTTARDQSISIAVQRDILGRFEELSRAIEDLSKHINRETTQRINMSNTKNSHLTDEKEDLTARLKIFLSYSSDDKDVVQLLYHKLKQEDKFDPWFDTEKIMGGQEWDKLIKESIKSSDRVIVCLSRKSVKKIGYFQKEIHFIIDAAMEQPYGAIFLIPVRLDECNIPGHLIRWQWVDLFDKTGYRRLVHALRGR